MGRTSWARRKKAQLCSTNERGEQHVEERSQGSDEPFAQEVAAPADAREEAVLRKPEPERNGERKRDAERTRDLRDWQAAVNKGYRNKALLERMKK